LQSCGRLTIISIVPWLFWGFFQLISPFIDPLTREKLKFDQNLRFFVPPEQLLKSYGGDLEFEYDHLVYWPALNALAAQRKQEQVERWIKAGKRVGELEGYLKGGDVKSLSEGERRGEDVEVDKSKQPNGLEQT
jgi:CRISPR/Cas system-associated protein Cas5 (RAMP superfamily)